MDHLKSTVSRAVIGERLRYGIAAILVGIVFVGVTGFAPIEAIHNAAHNTRHSISFPCH